MNLKFLSYTSILSLMTALSTPVMGMESDEPPHSLVTVRASDQVVESDWDQALFTKKYSLLEPTLDLTLLQKEILAVFMANRNSPKAPETTLRISRIQGLLDRESQKQSEDEGLQSFLFRLYSGRIMKNSPFHNQEKAVETLDKACQQEWGWAFWERALLKSLPASQLIRDHYLAANRGHQEAVLYVQQHTSYNEQVAETFLQALTRETKEKRRNGRVHEFETFWKNTGYARPFADVVQLLRNKRILTLEYLILQFSQVAANLGDVNKQVSVARHFMHPKDNDAVEIYLKKAAQNGHVPSMYDLGVEYQTRGDIKNAISMYFKAATLGEISSMSNLGALMWQNGDLDAAIAWSQKAAERGNRLSIFNLSAFLDKKGDLDMAIYWAKRSIEIGDSEGFFNLGLLMEQKWDKEKKEEDLKEAINLYKREASANNVEAIVNLGRLLVKSGNKKEGIAWWKKGAALDYPSAIYNLAYFFEKEGQLKRAIQWHEKAAKLNYVNSMYQLGFLLWEKGEQGTIEENVNKAIYWLRKAVAEGHLNARFGLGVIYENRGKLEEAIEYYQPAADQGHVPSMINLGSCLAQKGDLEAAIFWSRKAVNQQAEPEYHSEAMTNLGSCLAQKGDQEAIVWFTKAIKLGNRQAMYNLGVFLESKGYLNQAIIWYKKAALKGVVSAMALLGDVYLKLNRTAEALFWLEKGSSLGNELAEELLVLARKFEEAPKISETEEDKVSTSQIECEQKLEEVFEKLENPEIKFTSSLIKDLKSEESPKKVVSTPPSSDEDSEDDSIPSFDEVEIYKESKILNNPKTRREMARNLGQAKRKIEEEEKKADRQLSKHAQTIASSILSGKTDSLEEKDIKTLFEDPYFLGQVLFESTKSGFKVLSHHRGLKKHLNAGAHHKHGQEKYTGHIHPNTLRDIKAILELFDVKI